MRKRYVYIRIIATIVIVFFVLKSYREIRGVYCVGEWATGRLENQGNGEIKGAAVVTVYNMSPNKKRVEFKMRGRIYHYLLGTVTMDGFDIDSVHIVSINGMGANSSKQYQNFIEISPKTSYDVKVEGTAKAGKSPSGSRMSPRVFIDDPILTILSGIGILILIFEIILEYQKRKYK